MLKRLVISNNSGIRDTIEMNFEKGNLDYLEQFELNGYANPVFLYGKNSSGKTSILKTLQNIRNIMVGNYQDLNNPLAVQNYTNLSNNTKYEMEVIIDGINFLYKIEIAGSNKFVREEIKINGSNTYLDNQSWYLENGSTSFVRAMAEGSIVQEGNVNSNIELDTKNRIRNELFIKFYNYIKNIDFIDTRSKVTTRSGTIVAKLIIEKQDDIIEFTKKFNELPLIEYANVEVDSPSNLLAKFKGTEMEYIEKSKFISSGTSTFHQLLAVLFSKKPGELLVIDEIDITIHPTLIMDFIRKINEEFQIQIIASSHNTNMLSEIRPDQVFITSNENHSVKVIKVSDEYPRIREIQNLERMYYGNKFN